MGVRFKFNLKEPQNEESLLMVICRWDNQPIKLSTRQRVFVATWNNKKQLCITSKIYKKYQLVGMHTGRRSFATNMYKRRFPTIAILHKEYKR